MKSTINLCQENEGLYQYFYILGIEPDSVDISDFSSQKKYEKVNLKKPELITQFPPVNKLESNVDIDIIISHCFPKGYKLLTKETCPTDEFYYFSLDNLYKGLTHQNEKIYFTVAIIFEPVKSYLDIKYNNKIPPLPKSDDPNEKVLLEQIFIRKALVFSSFVPFPTETKTLMQYLLEYYRTNQLMLPVDKIIEGIMYGIPRPLRAYFNISCKKDKPLIPNQKGDIDFSLKDFNEFNYFSYPYQLILKFSVNDILTIFKCLLLEIPVLIFGPNKEALTIIIESFLHLLYPLEYQYPHISILPDSYMGLIETEKCFFFGINHSLMDNNQKPIFFKTMNLHIKNKLVLLCDLQTKKVFPYHNTSPFYHVVNFKDLGVYPETQGKEVDTTKLESKNINEGESSAKAIYVPLPEKKTNKATKDLSNFALTIQNEEYSPEINKKIGEDIFYKYLYKLLKKYNNYIYNDEENIKRVINEEIMDRNEEDIDIEKLFFVSQFLRDKKIEDSFYSQFLKTRIFKNFIIRKYLNKTLDRYMFLHFDEKILERNNKKFFSKKSKTNFSSSTIFKPSKTYEIKPVKPFNDSELSFMKSHKDVLLKKYYQQCSIVNKIKYFLFPKLIYDNKFFGKKEYKPGVNFSEDYKECLEGYKAIENNIKDGFKEEKIFDIYEKGQMNRYLADLETMDIKNEALNALNKVWVYVFCLTYHYFDEIEKYFRFEELMRFLPTVVDTERELFPLLLLTIKKYGDEAMLIKFFESAKHISYNEYCTFCSKFKADSNVVWEMKKLDTTNVRLNIFYYRDVNNDDKKLLSEIKNTDYDIASLQKKTFGGQNEQNKKEHISFELQYLCQYCGEPYDMMSLTINLNKKVKSKLMVCEKCQRNMEPVTYVNNAGENITFVIYSPIKLLNIAREIMVKYGNKINIDDLRVKYCSFFWNCVLYFYLAGLSYEILLKYKKNDIKNVNKVKKKERPKQRKFKKLKIQKIVVNI